MKTANCHLKSISPYSQGKFISEVKTQDETHDEFEKRSWRQRMHTNRDGYVFMPPMSFKNALAGAAKYKSVRIPGQGKSTYTKHIEAGVMVVDPLVLPVKSAEVDGEWLHVPSDGRRGGTKRVLKCFPLIHEWSGIVPFLILDEIVNNQVFGEHLEVAGSCIGVGRFRPRQNGYYGRFKIEKIEWS